MVRSHSDDNKGTEPPRLSPKVWTVGSIPVTDEGFLRWSGYQTKKGTPLAMMALYVQQLNLESKMLHEQHRKEQKESSHSPGTAEAVPLSKPNEPSTTSATEDAPMKSPTPKPQNISSPEQVLPRLPEQSLSHSPEHRTSPLDQSLAVVFNPVVLD